MFREEVIADHFNRHKLGRSLDACYRYGCDTLFAEISFEVCQAEKVDCRFNSEDTTTFSVTGEADSKLYCKKTITGPLKDIPFITRVPSTIQEERATITRALNIPIKDWEKIDDSNCYFLVHINHYQQAQRWIVVSSSEMKERAKKSTEKAALREEKALKKALSKIEKQEFSCKRDAESSLLLIKKKSKYHAVKMEEILEKKVYPSKGRPKADAKYTVVYHVLGAIEKDQEALRKRVKEKSCYVVGTTVKEEQLSSKEVVLAYKGQNGSVERGFRFLKDPLFFTSSLFLKKQERIEGLLMVMTLALLVYSIAQRRLRGYLQATGKTLPNQIKKEISFPTLRWIFQLMEGIEYVEVTIDGKTQKAVTGITELRMRILACFSGPVQKIYGIAA